MGCNCCGGNRRRGRTKLNKKKLTRSFYPKAYVEPSTKDLQQRPQTVEKPETVTERPSAGGGNERHNYVRKGFKPSETCKTCGSALIQKVKRQGPSWTKVPYCPKCLREV